MPEVYLTIWDLIGWELARNVQKPRRSFENSAACIRLLFFITGERDDLYHTAGGRLGIATTVLLVNMVTLLQVNTYASQRRKSTSLITASNQTKELHT